MRRRLLASTLTIALVCVVILGVPLAVLARNEVWSSAHDRLRAQAESVGADLEDRLDARAPLDLTRFARLMPDRRISVRAPGGVTATAGATIPDPITERVSVSDAFITVQAPRGPTVTRAREVTLVVIGLALLAALAAAALALRQARRLARPLADLADRADSLGRGEFTATPLESGVPEIDRVSGVLERSARQIGTVVDLQQQFASDAAHQLRTPLTSIGLHLDEIVRLGDRAVREEGDEALSQVQRLDTVITSLLARARGDSAAQVVVDLGELVTDESTPWRRLLETADRELVADLATGVTVLARRDHLVGVLGSLLDNAVAHGSGNVRVVVRREGADGVLRVRDDGPGVAPELVPSIFERRVSGSRGTGIGLALARSLAGAESGRLELSPDCPAEFVLTLPVTYTKL